MKDSNIKYKPGDLGFKWFKQNGKINPSLEQVIEGLKGYLNIFIETELMDLDDEEIIEVQKEYSDAFQHILDLLQVNSPHLPLVLMQKKNDRGAYNYVK